MEAFTNEQRQAVAACHIHARMHKHPPDIVQELAVVKTVVIWRVAFRVREIGRSLPLEIARKLAMLWVLLQIKGQAASRFGGRQMASANFCNLLGHASYQDLCTRIEHNQNGLESKTCAGVIQVSNVRTLCGKKARQNQQLLHPPCLFLAKSAQGQRACGNKPQHQAVSHSPTRIFAFSSSMPSRVFKRLKTVRNGRGESVLGLCFWPNASIQAHRELVAVYGTGHKEAHPIAHEEEAEHEELNAQYMKKLTVNL
eukprot:1161494-Pelagomonas_calceolata.AAC.2